MSKNVRRGPDGRLLPGSVLNPSGRPKTVKELAAKAAAHDEEALAVILSIMRNKRLKASDRLRAAEELLNRGYGRSPQAVTLKGDIDEPIVTGYLTKEQLDQVIAAAKSLGDDV